MEAFYALQETVESAAISRNATIPEIPFLRWRDESGVTSKLNGNNIILLRENVVKQKAKYSYHKRKVRQVRKQPNENPFREEQTYWLSTFRAPHEKPAHVAHFFMTRRISFSSG